MKTLLELILRLAVYLRFGRTSAEADIITDYLDSSPADFGGALRAWRAVR